MEEALFRIIWQNNSLPGKIITLTILVLGFVAAVCALLHIRRYGRREMRALRLVRQRLDIEVEANPSQLIPIETLREPVNSGKSLIADRLAAISKLRKASVKINVNSLQQMSRLKETSSLSLAIPGYAVGLAMMLGLLGTFIGLALMTQKLQILSEGTHATSLGAIRTDLGQITRGLKTGFSASLVGLTCSVGVSALNFLLARAQSRFYNELEQFTTEDLLPKTLPAVEDATLLEEVSQHMNEGFARIEAITKDHTQNIEHLKSVEDAFGQIIDNIKEITHHNANGDGADLVADVTGVIRQSTEVNKAVVNLTESIPRLAGDFQKTQETTLNKLGSLLKTQQDRVELMFRTHQEMIHRRNASPRPTSDAAGISPDDGKSTEPRSVFTDSVRLFLIATISAVLVLLIWYWLTAV